MSNIKCKNIHFYEVGMGDNDIIKYTDCVTMQTQSEDYLEDVKSIVATGKIPSSGPAEPDGYPDYHLTTWCEPGVNAYVVHLGGLPVTSFGRKFSPITSLKDIFRSRSKHISDIKLYYVSDDNEVKVCDKNSGWETTNDCGNPKWASFVIDTDSIKEKALAAGLFTEAEPSSASKGRMLFLPIYFNLYDDNGLPNWMVALTHNHRTSHDWAHHHQNGEGHAEILNIQKKQRELDKIPEYIKTHGGPHPWFINNAVAVEIS